MYDEPTQYFRKYTDPSESTNYDDYFYNGYGNTSSYGGGYDFGNQRGRDGRYDTRYIPPYDPRPVQRNTRYPQTYRDPYVNQYDYYQDNRPRYYQSYQQQQRPDPKDMIPPYEPEKENRRNDNVGLLNSDLFRSKERYSNPFIQKYERKYTPPTSTVYSKSNPISGGVCNNYTRPPVPRDPQINWADCLSRDRTGRMTNAYSNLYESANAYDSYDYMPPVSAPTIEESWYDTAKRNFPDDENL